MRSVLPTGGMSRRLICAVLLVAVAGVAVLVPAGPGGGAGGVSATGHESGLVGLVAVGPERVLDTRETGVMATPGEPVRAQLAGVPDDASAVVATVTVANAVGDGFVTVWGCDGEAPGTSNANFVGIDTVAASVIVEIGTAGEICVVTGQVAAHVIVDVFGYFTADAGIVTKAPTRVLDTRGTSGPVAAGTSVTAELSGLPDDAAAAIVNVTAANATGDGFFTVWDCDGDAPRTSNGNFVGVSTIANLAIVPVTAGEVCVQPGDAGTQVLVDLFGYLTTSSGFTTGGAERLLDTRTARELVNPGDVRTVTLDGVPAGATAIVNVTVTDAQGDGFFTVWNCDEAQPGTSNGNYVGVSTIANLVLTTTSEDSTICVTTGDAAANLIVDTLASLPAPANPLALAYPSDTVIFNLINDDPQDATTTGGRAPYTYAVTTSALPPGVDLDTDTGAISVTSLLNMTADRIFAGGNHTCALENGAVYCWGWNASGQLGDGSETNRTTPVEVESGSDGFTNTNVEVLSVGRTHTCALEAGVAYCWGYNDYGQLGDDTTIGRATPVKVASGGGFTNSDVTAISAGDNHTCAIEDGAAYCWGRNNFGQLGDGTTTRIRTTPVKVESGSQGFTNSNVIAISGGGSHTCAIEDGYFFCWGRNEFGQLGDGTTRNSTTPVKVATGGGFTNTEVIAIDLGTQHSCALKGGEAYCWGDNGSGRLGDGSTDNRTAPVKVSPVDITFGNVGLVGLAAGLSHTCALGAFFVDCWGGNGDGQLGNPEVPSGGSRTATRVTSTVGGFLNVGATGLATGENHTCAIEAGFVYCWGWNNRGQLGDRSTADRSAPVPVVKFETVTRTVTVTATDADGRTANASLSVTVEPPMFVDPCVASRNASPRC